MPRLNASYVAAIVSLAALRVSVAMAQVHPDVERGVELARQANFDGTLAAFSQAERRTDLSKSDLETLLAFRALAFHALSDSEAAADAIRHLVSIAPGYALGPEHPEATRTMFDEARRAQSQPIHLEAKHEVTGQSLLLRTHVSDDPWNLVREVRIFVARGTSPFEAITAREHREVLARGSVLRYYATAVGPGGAIIATSGSESAPFEARVASVSLQVPSAPATPGRDRPRGSRSPLARSWWLWTTVGAVVIGGSVTALLLTRDKPAPEFFSGNVPPGYIEIR